MCVTVSDDGSVRVWDMSTNNMVAVRSLGRAARSVGYSHDGGTLAVGMKDGEFVSLSLYTDSCLEETGVLCMCVCLCVCVCVCVCVYICMWV